MLSQLPHFWLDAHHANTLIEISVSRRTGCGLDGPQRQQQSHSHHPQQQRRPTPVATLPCHKVLLSAASSYFAALLSPAWSSSGHSAAGCCAGSSPRRVHLALTDLDDVLAMVALLKCIYTSSIHLDPSDLAAVLNITHGSSSTTISHSHAQPRASRGPALCADADVAAELVSRFASTCCQELAVRVLRLADEYAVPGALTAAVKQLSCLFTYQLSWTAVLAVLWLPAALGTQPAMQDLRQMAVNRVIQDMKHLDPCLSSSLGRHLLQQLPPDALAALLGSDQLAVASENSVIAAIDVWLAGPVAASSLATAKSSSSSHSISSNHGISAAEDEPEAATTGPGAAKETDADMTTSGKVCREGRQDDEPGSSSSSSSSSKLDEVLELLMQQVRLPLCSGACLAAAVAQRPWLCRAMQHRLPELRLLQQYYSSDAQGRYDLAMHLLSSRQSCPWAVTLRRGVHACFHASSSTIFSGDGCSGRNTAGSGVPRRAAASAAGTLGIEQVHTGLSQLRALLEAGPDSPAAPAAAPAAGAGEGAQGGADKTGFAAGCTTLLSEPQVPGSCWQQQMSTGNGSCGRSILLFNRVMCGYIWQAELVTVSARGSCSSSDARRSGSSAIMEAAAAAAAAAGSSTRLWKPETVQQPKAAAMKLLCLAVSCRPAWADALAGCSSYSSGCCCGCSTVCDNNVSGGGESHSSAGINVGCATCASLWAIAGAKAKEAVARHTPRPAAALALQVLQGCRATCVEATAAVTAAAAAAVGHLDVVIGLQLVAAATQDELQQLTSGSSGSSSSSRHPAQCFQACLLPWNAAAGAACGLLQIDTAGIGRSTNLLAGGSSRLGAVGSAPHPAGAAAAAGGEAAGVADAGKEDMGLLPGWQPEVWSALAPSGSLHWRLNLRQLMD